MKRDPKVVSEYAVGDDSRIIGGSSIYEFTKRFFDIILSLLLLLLMTPIFALVYIIIVLTSGFPGIYRGKRVGLNGKLFYIYKFRTMVPHAEKTGGDTTARDDPRVTPIGKILRKYKIDEIPQLVNVLQGKMSFVGPRPELVDYVNRYSEEERIILSVRPGITDISSLKFSSLDEYVGSDDADRVFEERILPEKNALRVKYIKERCLSLDISILFRTVLAVLRKMIAAKQH